MVLCGMYLHIHISPWFYMGCIYPSISPYGFIWDVFILQYLPRVLYGMYLPINISPWFYMGWIYQSISPHGFIWVVFTLQYLPMVFMYGMYLSLNISPWFYMGCIYALISPRGLYGMYLPFNIPPCFYMVCIYPSISPMVLCGMYLPIHIKMCISFLSHKTHDDVIKWKHFPRYWPFVRGIHRSPVNYPHKGRWRGTLMFPLICVGINGWINNREARDLRRYVAHYDVFQRIFMRSIILSTEKQPITQDFNKFQMHTHRYLTYM